MRPALQQRQGGVLLTRCTPGGGAQAGVELDEKGGIKVDEFSRSVSAPNVWAVGDVTNRLPLTPVARMEGTQLARHLFGWAPPRLPAHAWDPCEHSA